jgi:hypothetical protein
VTWAEPGAERERRREERRDRGGGVAVQWRCRITRSGRDPGRGSPGARYRTALLIHAASGALRWSKPQPSIRNRDTTSGMS